MRTLPSLLLLALLTPIIGIAAPQVQAGRGGTAVSLNGNNNQIVINQNADRYLKLLEAAQRREGLQPYIQDTAQIIAERKQLAQRLAQDTQTGSNNPAAQRAVAGLEQGNLKPTADYLRDVAAKARATGVTANAQAAAAMRQLASISSIADALPALQHATEYEPDNALNWNLLGDMQLQAGNLPQAEAAYRTMLRLTAVASQAQPSDNDLLRNLSVAHEKIGEIQQAQGDLSGALGSYRKGLEIAERLAQQDAANTEWQRGLSVSHDRIGDIQQAQGDLSGALGSYQKSLDIRQRLAQQDATNTQWQFDLGISHERVGSIQQAQGDLVGALASYRRKFEIIQRLTQQDETNTEWLRDLSVSYNKIGNIQQAQGDLSGALGSYRKDLKIAERLALQDAANVLWQTDVVISCVKLSRLRGQGVSDQEAAGYLQKALGIAERLQREGKLNAQQQGWVKALRGMLAQIGAK